MIARLRDRAFWSGPWPALVGYLLLALLLARDNGGVYHLTHRDGDARMLMLPLWQFTATHLQAGDVPLWNPAIFGGLPHLAAFLPALCYPTTWLLAVMPAHSALAVHLVVHLVLAGMGARAWALQRGASPGGAAVAGLAWAFGWSVLGQVAWGTTPQVAALAWIPWTCGWAERAMGLVPDRVPRPADTVATAAGIALIAFCGHPQYLYLTTLLLVLLALAGGRPLGRRDWWRPGARLAPAGLLGGALAAVQLVPGALFLAASSRAGGLAAGVASSYNLPPRHLLLAGVPGMLGPNASDTLPYWGEWNAFDGVAAVALPVLILAACAPLHAGRRTGLWICVGVGLLLALGDATPAWSAATWVLPGLGSMRTPSRLAFFAVLATALLAGQGASALLGDGVSARRAGRRTAWLGALAALIAAGLAGVFLATGPEGGPWREFVAFFHRPNDRFDGAAASSTAFLQESHRHGVFVLIAACGFATMTAGVGLYRALEKSPAWLTGAILWGLLAASALVSVGGAIPTMASGHLRLPHNIAALLGFGDPQVRWLNDTSSPNSALTEGSRSLGGWGPVLPRRTARLLERAEGAEPGAPLFVRPLRRPGPAWDAAAVQFAVSVSRRSGRDQQLPDVLRDSPAWVTCLPDLHLRCFRRTDPVPRARLVHGAVVAPDADAALEWVAEGRQNPRETVVLESGAAPLAAPAGAGAGRAEFVEDSPDRIEIRTSGTAPGILVLADAWDDGWRVTVDGRPAAPLHADYAFRGVAVPAGRHTVVWSYTPRGLAAGLAVTLLALLWCAVWLTWARRVRAARPAAATPA